MVFKQIQQNSAQGSIVFICPALNKNYQACKHSHNQSNQSREMNPEMTAMMELADKNSEGCITDKPHVLTDRGWQVKQKVQKGPKWPLQTEKTQHVKCNFNKQG